MDLSNSNLSDFHTQHQIEDNKEKIKLQLYVLEEIIYSSNYLVRLYEKTPNTLKENIVSYKKTIEDLKKHRIQPYHVIGDGYLSYYAYPLAKNWLLNNIASCKRALKIIAKSSKLHYNQTEIQF